MIKANRISESQFLRNVATLASGTAIAQIVAFVFAPALYRIYSKEDYGLLGLFLAILGVLSAFGTLQYTQVILLENDEEKAKLTMLLVRVINVVVSLVVLLLVFFARDIILNLLNSQALSFWCWLLPISVFFKGQNEILRVWANRKGKYQILNTNSILTAILVPIVSLSIGIMVDGPSGLFYGLLVSQVFPCLILYFYLYSDSYISFRSINWNDSKSILKSYIKFPKYTLPAVLVNTISHQLPVFMLGAFSGTATVGLYNLSARVLGLPITLITSAVGEVYKREATREFNEVGSLRKIYLKTTKSLLGSGIIGFALFFILAPYLFELVFGSEWREAGNIARILTLVYLLRYINAPISFVINIKGKQRIDLIASIWFVVSTALVMYLGFTNFSDFHIPIIFFALNFCSIYFFMIYYNHKISME